MYFWIKLQESDTNDEGYAMVCSKRELRMRLTSGCISCILLIV